MSRFSQIQSKNAALLRKQAEEQGGLKRQFKAKEWCATVLKHRPTTWITEDEYQAAVWAREAFELRSGVLGGGLDRVDSTANGQELKTLHMIGSEWYGLEQAISLRIVGRQTKPALEAICEGESIAGVAHKCCFLRLVKGKVRADEKLAEALVRLILTALADYRNDCVDSRGKSPQEKVTI